MVKEMKRRRMMINLNPMRKKKVMGRKKKVMGRKKKVKGRKKKVKARRRPRIHHKQRMKILVKNMRRSRRDRNSRKHSHMKIVILIQLRSGP